MSRENYRYIRPTTPVGERIDEVVSWHSGKEEQARWLKKVLQEQWPETLPQPFVGFDDQDDAFVLVWISDTEYHTLYVDTQKRTGDLGLWPEDSSTTAVEELDLTTQEAWLCLRTALSAGRGE